MRLNFMHIHAYGALADTTLELGDGLTVVYGLNEAGKSTLLSAYADLLCGIDRETPMDFLVARPRLRIQASITLDNGTAVRAIRTSKRPPKDLVNTSTSEPIAEEVRQSLTQGLSHKTLFSRFGLNHTRLVNGGRELVHGRGDLAEIVFEAGSGLAVRTVVDMLESKLAALYKPHAASTSLVVRANAVREDLSISLRETMSTAEAVEQAAVRANKLEAELERSRRATANLRLRLGQLNQWIDSWPYWEQYRARRDELEEIDAEGPHLSLSERHTVHDDFSRLNAIHDEIREQKAAIEYADREYSALDIDNSLLEARNAIEFLANEKPKAESAKTRALELNGLAMAQRSELVEILLKIGVQANDDPQAAFASVTVAEDRAADLNDLSGQHDQLREDHRKSKQAVREATSQLESAQQAAGDLVDPEFIALARRERDRLWHLVKGVWLNRDAIPTEFSPDPIILADRYATSVNYADEAIDSFASGSAGRATVTERRRTLMRSTDSLQRVQQQLAEWQTAWNVAAHAAGLPPGLGVEGWRQRSELLSQAGSFAVNIRSLENERAQHAVTAEAWNAAAASLTKALGQNVETEQYSVWFDSTKAKYEETRSNQKASQIHLSTKAKATEHLAQLLEEKLLLESSLETVASRYRIGIADLEVLVYRTAERTKILSALAEPEAQLRARHPESTFEELTNLFASRDFAEVTADLDTTKDALQSAEQAENSFQESAISARMVLDELTGRKGAEALQQDLSQANAQVLDLIEDYATTRLMHHLLTHELRTYLESHQNPVLARASEYLGQLTQGRFVRLREEGQGNNRSLIVVGADDEDYELAALSEGTASQLYLALSLAGVLEVEEERRQGGLETVPIMLDDVLMAFDDERARCALNLLVEIGQKQQMVLFTHHAAVRDQASALGGAVRVVSVEGPASRSK